MKQVVFACTVLSVIILSYPAVVSAQTFPQRLREKRQEKIDEIKEKKENLIDSIKEQIREKTQALKFNARITGSITAMGDQSLTVSGNDGKTYEVFITEKTKIKRRYWGNSEIDEFSVGNQVNIVGKWKNDEQTQIDAILVRNASIQKRHGVFIGTISSKGDSSFVVDPIKRENQTVFFDSNTKLVNRKEESISYSDLAVNHRVRIKGLWDQSANTVTEVTHIKDFSLPVITTPTP